MFNLNFNNNTRREFKYKPRFYDEQKDAIQQKIRLKAKENEDTSDLEKNELRKERITQAFSQVRVKTPQQKQEDHKIKLSAQLRRLMIIFIFFLGLYWVANEYLPDFLNYLTKGSLEIRTEQLDNNQDLEDDIDYRNPIRHQ